MWIKTLSLAAYIVIGTPSVCSKAKRGELKHKERHADQKSGPETRTRRVALAVASCWPFGCRAATSRGDVLEPTWRMDNGE